MHRLPPLCRPHGRYRLPLADRSAAGVVGVLVDLTAAPPGPQLAQALAADPPFLLWATARAGQAGIEPAGVDDIAAWLAPRLLDELSWLASEASQPPPRDPRPSDSLAEHVARALALSELTERLAAGDGSVPPKTAAFWGLLEPAGRFLAEAEPEAAERGGGGERDAQ